MVVNSRVKVSGVSAVRSGRGIASVEVNSDGHLIVTYTDDTTTDAGLVSQGTSGGGTGATGRGIASLSISDGHLVAHYTDNTTQDVGQVVGAAGQDGTGGGGSSSSSFNPRGAFNPQSDYAPGDVVLLNGGQASFYFTQACASGQFDGSQGFALGVNGEYVAEAVGPAVAQYLQDHPVSGGGGTPTSAPVPGAPSAPRDLPLYDQKGLAWDGMNSDSGSPALLTDYDHIEFVTIVAGHSASQNSNAQAQFPIALDTGTGVLDPAKYPTLEMVGNTVVSSDYDQDGSGQANIKATQSIGGPFAMDPLLALAGYADFGAVKLPDTPTGSNENGKFCNTLSVSSAWNSNNMVCFTLNCSSNAGYLVMLQYGDIDPDLHTSNVTSASIFRQFSDGSYAIVATGVFNVANRFANITWTDDHILIANQSNEVVESDVEVVGTGNFIVMHADGSKVTQRVLYNGAPTDVAFIAAAPSGVVATLPGPGRALVNSSYASLVAARAVNRDGVAGPLSASVVLTAGSVPDAHPYAHFNHWTPLSAEVKLGDSGDPEATIHAMPPSTAPLPSLFDFRAFMLRTDGAVIPLLNSYKTKVDQGDGSVIFKCAPYLQYGQTLDPGVFTMMTYSQADTLQLRNDDLNFDVSVTVKPINYPQAEIAAQWSPAQIQAQPSGYSLARAVKNLTIWNDRIYASYGDVNENTGPIDVMSMDLNDTSAGFISEATLTTEQLGPYRAFGDKLYAVFMDPQGGIGNPENGMYAWRTTSDPTWHTVPNTTPYAEHVYDIAVLANGDIFLCGLAETVDGDTADLACVWVSHDDGATWEVSYSNPSTEGVWPSRFYLFGDTLCIYDASSSNWLTYDGTSVWTPGDITGGAYPNAYDAYQNDSVHAHISVAYNNSADCDVYIGQGNIIGDPVKSVYAGMYLQEFPGLAKRAYMGLGDAKTGIPCVDSGGFRIYLVDSNRNVFSFATTNPDTTQRLEFQLPALSTDVWGLLGPMCLAVDSQRNVIYWGGFDGTIYSAYLPARAE